VSKHGVGEQGVMMSDCSDPNEGGTKQKHPSLHEHGFPFTVQVEDGVQISNLSAVYWQFAPAHMPDSGALEHDFEGSGHEPQKSASANVKKRKRTNADIRG
jgi:hypothetical protein